MNKVTVIIPNKNYTHYLDAAIESVREQTEPCDLIVIDYGSTEPHSETTHWTDGTLSEARNIAVSKVNTPYILCLDADDTLEPKCVEKMLALASENTVVASDGRFFGDSRGVFIAASGDFTECNQILNCSLFPRELWIDVGGWDESLSGYEDWDFWLRAQKQGYTFKTIPESLVNIRAHGDSRNTEAKRNHEELVAKILSK
jgi:glycosyltransferase involved in cell wall biosynthesis